MWSIIFDSIKNIKTIKEFHKALKTLILLQIAPYSFSGISGPKINLKNILVV